MNENQHKTIELMIMFHNNLIKEFGENDYWTGIVKENLTSYGINNIVINDDVISEYKLPCGVIKKVQ